MFNSLAIKLLLKENARLRTQNRRLEQRIDEMLDTKLHSRVPDRLVDQRSSEMQVAPILAGDGYTSALMEADRDARAQKSEEAVEFTSDVLDVVG